MKLAIKNVLTDGPKYGYYLNKEKGTYLMSACSNLQEANIKKQELIDIGLHSSIIQIHPSNLLSTSSTTYNDSYYGAKLLGSFIETDSYFKQ